MVLKSIFLLINRGKRISQRCLFLSSFSTNFAYAICADKIKVSPGRKEETWFT